MSKNYRKIEFGAGDSIEEAIKDLSTFKERGELVCGEFNGQTLFSDVDDLDSAYLKITGKTKAEFDEAERIRMEEYEAEKRRHEESIPELTKEWIEKGQEVLDIKYLVEWNKCVPIRLGDLYRGMELKCCLDIVKELKSFGVKVEIVDPHADSNELKHEYGFGLNKLAKGYDGVIVAVNHKEYKTLDEKFFKYI